MTRFFYILLYLNIYIAFSSGLAAQEIKLSILAEQSISKELKDSLNFNSSFTDFLSLKRETDTIFSKLQRLGYFESELQSLHKLNDSVYQAKYFLGRRYKQIKIFYSQNDFSVKELSDLVKEVNETYFMLTTPSVEKTLEKLNSLKTRNGNAFASLRLSNIRKNGEILEATLLLNGGPVKTIDSIIVKGYEKFPSSFLKYYAGVKTGRKFEQSRLVSQNEILNNLGFVKTIKPPEVLFKKDTTTVYFYLDKQNNNLFDGILGFATNEDTQKLEFNGYLNLELNNNLNFGEQLLINYKADGKEQQNFRVKTILPYLFKSPFGLELELKIFKRDSTFVTTEQQARLHYQLNPTSKIYLGYKGYESSNLLDEIIAGSPIEDYTSKFVTAGWFFIKPQTNLLFPVRTSISVDSEIGKRTQKDLDEDQVRLMLTVNHIFNLNSNNSIFLQNNTSNLISDTYLTNELFRFGGINSIRGFDENSIDASLFSVLNTEYRYQFNTGIYIHSIIDLAYFENQTISLKEKLYSFGIGLGLQTKAGVFKFNIANGNSENQDFNFSNTKIHLSLSSRF